MDNETAMESTIMAKKAIDITNIQDDFTNTDDMFEETGVGEGD